MRKSVQALLAMALCCLISPVPSLAESNLRTAENRQFEIVGLDSRSVTYIDELSRFIVEVSERYLDSERLRFPQRVLISLKPKQYVDFEGDYEIRVAEPGLVSLDLLWEEEVSLRTVFRAVSEALIVRYSIFNYGRGGLEYLPEWPAAAVGTEAYLRLRPALSDQLINWVDLSTTATIHTLLNRGWDEPVADANGYLLLLAIKEGGVAASELRGLIDRALSGADVAELLEALLKLKNPAAIPLDLENWWQASLVQVVLPKDGVVETMDVSQRWIKELSDVSNLGDGGLDLRSIWKQRDDAELRATIQARYEIIRLRLIRVNPGYYNAARSLGFLFEVFLNSERSFEYIHSLTAFLSDYSDAQEIESLVNQVLSIELQ
ncbi:MAG: hypothetical protein AAF065_02380 [Verrucomicrobiota bacterium]